MGSIPFGLILTKIFLKKDIRDVDNKINNELLIIQHVENIYKNISFATNDIKNLVELMKLEMQ